MAALSVHSDTGGVPSRTLLPRKGSQRRSQRCIGATPPRHDNRGVSSGLIGAKPPKRECVRSTTTSITACWKEAATSAGETPGSERARRSVLRFLIRRRKLGILAADHGGGAAPAFWDCLLASRSIAGPRISQPQQLLADLSKASPIASSMVVP